MNRKQMKWTHLTAFRRNSILLKGLVVVLILLAVVVVPMSLAQRSTPTAPSATSVKLQEDWAFMIKDYAIEHQGKAIIDIAVSYDYVNGIGVPDPQKYPDFVPISNFIKNFLVNYPNEKDFWEILNKNLVTALLTQPIPTPYGVQYKLNELLETLTIKIDVKSGAADVNIPRSSTVTGSPNRSLKG